jgi:hypothetical protein
MRTQAATGGGGGHVAVTEDYEEEVADVNPRLMVQTVRAQALSSVTYVSYSCLVACRSGGGSSITLAFRPACGCSCTDAYRSACRHY